MIHFPKLITPRMSVGFRELTIGQAIDLAAVPIGRHETATDALLKCVVQDVDGQMKDPGRWTVQERMLAVAHYLSCVNDEGGNFAVGSGRFLDYLDSDADAVVDRTVPGMAGGDEWEVRQLSGDEALGVESLCERRSDWLFADMAARMSALDGKEKPRPDATEDTHAYREWLKDRKDLFSRLAESDFAEVYALYRIGLQDLHHYFRLEFDAQGFVVMPREGQGEGVQMEPARFPVSACYSELARFLGD